MSNSSVSPSLSHQDSSWDPSPQAYPSPGVVKQTKKGTKAKSAPVRDSWDDEDDDGDEEGEEGGEASREDPAELWRDANASAPMPALVISSSSAIPPLEAFAAPMRILKRPTASSHGSANSTASTAAGQRSMKDREAEYAAARERIFAGGRDAVDGEDEPTPTDQNGSRGNSKSPKPSMVKGGNDTSPAGVSVLRNPRGPTSSPGGTSARGFGNGGKRGAGKGGGTVPSVGTAA